MHAAEIAEAAGKREAGHPGLGNQPARCGESEGLGLAIHVAPSRAALDNGEPPLGVYIHGTHLREVDHESGVACGVAGDVVPAPTYGHGQLLRLGETHRLDHIGRAAAASDDGWPPVDHRIPQPARVVECCVTVGQHTAGEVGLQVVNRDILGVHGSLPTQTLSNPSSTIGDGAGPQQWQT